MTARPVTFHPAQLKCLELLHYDLLGKSTKGWRQFRPSHASVYTKIHLMERFDVLAERTGHSAWRAVLKNFARGMTAATAEGRTRNEAARNAIDEAIKGHYWSERNATCRAEKRVSS